jgi:hypothetical protein
MPTKEELVVMLTAAVYGDPNWVGRDDDVLLDSINWNFVGGQERADLQLAGETHGCHICKKKIKDNPDSQVWIADHQPPVGFTAGAREHYLPGAAAPAEQRLFPHCSACSKVQSSVVRAIRASAQGGKWCELNAAQLGLIVGHPVGHDGVLNYIVTTAESEKATATECALIQAKGSIFGCHCCGTKIPVTDYEADHVPPATLYQYTWASALIKSLIVMPTKMKIRPACGSCQRGQGGTTAYVLKQCARYIYAANENAVIYTPGFARHQV